jgi:hypothetical protein
MDSIQSVAADLRDLTEAFQITNRGLTAVVKSLAIHGEMLTKILQAVTEPAEDASPLTDLLARLAAADADHKAMLIDIASGVERIERGMIAAAR